MSFFGECRSLENVFLSYLENVVLSYLGVINTYYINTGLLTHNYFLASGSAHFHASEHGLAKMGTKDIEVYSNIMYTMFVESSQME